MKKIPTFQKETRNECYEISILMKVSVYVLLNTRRSDYYSSSEDAMDYFVSLG